MRFALDDNGIWIPDKKDPLSSSVWDYIKFMQCRSGCAMMEVQGISIALMIIVNSRHIERNEFESALKIIRTLSPLCTYSSAYKNDSRMGPNETAYVGYYPTLFGFIGQTPGISKKLKTLMEIDGWKLTVHGIGPHTGDMYNVKQFTKSPRGNGITTPQSPRIADADEAARNFERRSYIDHYYYDPNRDPELLKSLE